MRADHAAPTPTPTFLDPNKSCLVVGESAARAVSVCEWLLSAGARDVSVSLAGRGSSGGSSGSGWLARRLALLAAHYDAAVCLRMRTASEPEELVQVH